ncbi:MAG: Spi family protease inhibitor, partial [Bacteroidia bacterium]|nr:Spi family protease inhibitor [Bacteroidia bacterium]
MKSQIFNRFLVLCLALSGWSQMTAMADEVSKNQALTIAGKVVQQYFPAESQLLSPTVSISNNINSDEPFYVCNVGNTGFVLVAKNDYCPPILGFSWESNFPLRNGETPALMSTVLDNIRNQCDDYARRDTVNPSILKSWQSFTVKNSGSPAQTGAIAPLLVTSWNCDSTFFDLFPKSFNAGGSVPIAMGQVFRFYGEPSNGTDELCYILNGYGKLCARLNQARFRFDRMSNTLGNPAVDSLIFYMAVTCMMQPEGAALDAYRTTLPQYFGYSNEM